jgi:3-phenylpropionate/trans-cinnamate dioxygenase ferredoxin component
MDKVVVLKAPLAPGEVRCVQVEKKPVAVWNIGGTYYGAEDFCPHLGGPLSEGTLEGTCVTCPWHGAKFDLATGKALEGPSKRDLVVYRVTAPTE